MVSFPQLRAKFPRQLIRHIDGDTSNHDNFNIQMVEHSDILLHPTWTIDYVHYLNGAETAYVDRCRELLGNGIYRPMAGTYYARGPMDVDIEYINIDPLA